jgi:hypothetical protein
MFILSLVLAFVKSGDLPVACILCVVCFSKLICGVFSFKRVLGGKTLFL